MLLIIILRVVLLHSVLVTTVGGRYVGNNMLLEFSWKLIPAHCESKLVESGWSDSKTSRFSGFKGGRLALSDQ